MLRILIICVATVGMLALCIAWDIRHERYYSFDSVSGPDEEFFDKRVKERLVHGRYAVLKMCELTDFEWEKAYVIETRGVNGLKIDFHTDFRIKDSQSIPC
jgi:hypothetical protein